MLKESAHLYVIKWEATPPCWSSSQCSWALLRPGTAEGDSFFFFFYLSVFTDNLRIIGDFNENAGSGDVKTPLEMEVI